MVVGKKPVGRFDVVVPRPLVDDHPPCDTILKIVLVRSLNPDLYVFWSSTSGIPDSRIDCSSRLKPTNLQDTIASTSLVGFQLTVFVNLLGFGAPVLHTSNRVVWTNSRSQVSYPSCRTQFLEFISGQSNNDDTSLQPLQPLQHVPRPAVWVSDIFAPWASHDANFNQSFKSTFQRLFHSAYTTSPSKCLHVWLVSK